MDVSNPIYYVNREISWLAFNERVLEEVLDKSIPLLDRFKFLAITASNLDEFFMVRVSGLVEQVACGFVGKDPAGLTAIQQLKSISKVVHTMVGRQYNCLTRSLLPALEKEKIFLKHCVDLDEEQKIFVSRYFKSTIFPVITPMAINSSHPFPLLNTKALNIITELKTGTDEESYYAVVPVPSGLPRIIPIKSNEHKYEFVLIEDLIKCNLQMLFTGYTVKNAALFRLTRNSDIAIEEESEDLMREIEMSIKKRKWGAPVRLELEKNMAKSARRFLKAALKVNDDYVFEISGPLDLTMWMGFSSLSGYDNLRVKPFPPQPVPEFLNQSMFEALREQDVLVHHPYQSFDCVTSFIKIAASDPDVLAIKQTLYRVSGNSPIVRSLIQAAENGKQVTVLVELKARFDEENNIQWARRLEQSGCHVIYGLSGLKTHCKICLVVKREDDGIRRYIHLGTGNYNDSTARIYTDFGYFTCKESFGQDISALFNILTGYSKAPGWNKIAVAPTSLRELFIRYIENETQNAKEGKSASITAKMNSLVDIGIIQALYNASMAGVKIRLIVRGICCLKSGIEGISDNITVYSIVDRFLEHSRIYCFENSGRNRVFLSSADWMPRNLDRRVEVAFPIEDPQLAAKIINNMEISIADTVKMRVQQPDGTYERIDRRGKEYIHSQQIFYDMAVREFEEADDSVADLNLFREI